MSTLSQPVKKIIILVGGGHTHALFLLQWAKQPVANTQLIVFDTQSQVAYTGMLPGFIAGHYSEHDLYIDIQELALAAGADFCASTITQLDAKQQTVTTSTDEIYEYDILSIDIGIHSSAQALPASDSATVVGVKPLTAFAKQWQEFIQHPTSSTRPVAVIGGGVAGVELALAMEYRLRTHSSLTPNISIVEAHAILPQVSEVTRTYLLSQLKAHGILVRSNVAVQEITPTNITLSDQSIIPSEFTVAATGPHPYQWVSETQLPCTDGYLQVDATLRSPSYANVFAVGDCAHFVPYPLPKAGVYAVRQAPYLYRNICALLHEKPLQVFKPQKNYLKLITLGSKYAAADKWGWCLRGVWLWYLKHSIDTLFMRRLR